jgi:hypothetical protein
MKRREFMATLGGIAGCPAGAATPMLVLSSRTEQQAKPGGIPIEQTPTLITAL